MGSSALSDMVKGIAISEINNIFGPGEEALNIPKAEAVRRGTELKQKWEKALFISSPPQLATWQQGNKFEPL